MSAFRDLWARASDRAEQSDRKAWKVLSRLVVGPDDNPMLVRWRLIQTPWFGIYLHFIHREDMDPVPHDHPWVFWRLVLRGGYRERYWSDPTKLSPTQVLWWKAGEFGKFPVEHAHYIDVVLPGTTTLVVTGPKKRVWGFWPNETTYGIAAGGARVTVDSKTGKIRVSRRRWVDFRDALHLRPSEGVR